MTHSTLRRSGLPLFALILTMTVVVSCNNSGSSNTEMTDGDNSAAADPVPVANPWFENIASTAGVDVAWVSGHDERYYLPEITGGGAAVFDFDGDGWLDIYLLQGGSLPHPDRNGVNELYRNNRDGTFTLVEGAMGDTGYAMGVACGDIDGDGDEDVYITNVGANVMFRNDGNGSFTDVTESAGVGDAGWGASTAFADYDLDGDLDLYVCNYVNWSVGTELTCFNMMSAEDYCAPVNYNAHARDVLYRNDGDGTFTDVTDEAGIGAAFGNGLGVAWGDFTGDGRPDAFIANDGMADQLWANQGDGTFIDIAMVACCSLDQEGKAKAGMGITVADIDDDQDLDVIVCNLEGESDSFFRNEGNYFIDATTQSGLRQKSRPFTRFGMGWVDFNNDGDLDLYQANGRVSQRDVAWDDQDPYAEPNLIFEGSPGPKFTEVEPRGGTSEVLIHTSRAAAFGDLDNDGGMDIVVGNRDAPAYILRNVVRDRGNWIMFDVRDAAGRLVIGATVSVSSGGRTVWRDVRPGYSYLASNDHRVHVGLGSETDATVSVRWPDGSEQDFGTLAGGEIHRLVREGGA